ncbi:heavy metal-associated domain-containing protein [Flavobacterium sp.]|jgi:copper chaperone CopZ|uniref:heavy-metal-associated domain-containing protein n=1 Tax=Flavobacterium sp. TaxID=239 RepID=UPI002A7EDABB|nr:heavy metal-associated domain-containing protein [Flavobacterium sp.]
MKKIFLIITVITLGMFNANAQISKAEIRAMGLTCSMCSNAINKQLKSIDGVESVETDLNTNTFTVTLKENNTLSPKVFKEGVEKAGFFIGSLIVTSNSETINNANYILIKENDSASKEIKFQVLDKGYVTDKEFKKLSKSFKNITTYAINNEDDFHIKTLN